MFLHLYSISLHLLELRQRQCGWCVLLESYNTVTIDQRTIHLVHFDTVLHLRPNLVGFSRCVQSISTVHCCLIGWADLAGRISLTATWGSVATSIQQEVSWLQECRSFCVARGFIWEYQIHSTLCIVPQHLENIHSRALIVLVLRVSRGFILIVLAIIGMNEEPLDSPCRFAQVTCKEYVILHLLIQED